MSDKAPTAEKDVPSATDLDALVLLIEGARRGGCYAHDECEAVVRKRQRDAARRWFLGRVYPPEVQPTPTEDPTHDSEVCHCGEPVTYGFDGDPTHHRGMCVECDAVRCDAYPGACAPDPTPVAGTTPEDRPEKVEYRVMRYSEKHGIWFSHTGGTVTDNPDIAEAWLGQAKNHGAARLETRCVTVWAEVTDA
jgi:hypothetical protein